MSLICKWMKSCFHMKGLAPRLVLRKRLKEIRTWPYLHMLLFSITDFVIGLKISRHFHSQLKLNQNQSWLAHRAHCVADTHCCGHIVADTLLPMMLLGLRKLGNICRGHKIFLNKIRNLFCSGHKICPQQMLRARANRETSVSATMCPRLPGPIHVFPRFVSATGASLLDSLDCLLWLCQWFSLIYFSDTGLTTAANQALVAVMQNQLNGNCIRHS